MAERKTFITEEDIKEFCTGCDNLKAGVICKLAVYSLGFSQIRRVADRFCDASIVNGVSGTKTEDGYIAGTEEE
ncbi:MAG: hypothetical protein UT39_C0022G0001 [Candidatus Woesebacteria bacterium GW2011_GWA1_39_21]|uniref:Uncharacterized protein n=1 Tax=Candidatus Woesebacteria bacterium GW2011_GWA1_39_21 TaxID=1618550 RepID=A0A0G0R8Y0_9BACT|nr:MAG: hypothetical protein UT39_C0022G0001 [Candidatus Woesebacteria bacterium GW2011_GWA1_39_21]